MKRIYPTTLIFILCLSTLKAQTSTSSAIHEDKYLAIGGTEQWVTIHGSDTDNPVVLMLHGGPGSTMTPFDSPVLKEWQKDFTIVLWDQRGAGRTYAKNDPPEELDVDYLKSNPLSLELMSDDGIELSEYLINHLGKEKIILFGSSWGSALGATMALKRPDLFHAYIGHSQIVNPSVNLTTSYQTVLKLAGKAGDTASIEMLEKIGSPPYDEAKKFGQFFRILKQYEMQNEKPSPDFWWKWSQEYDNETDRKARFMGDDYSFFNYVGHQKLGITGMYEGINYLEDGLTYELPVYFIQGAGDIMTSKKSTSAYFEKIKAPEKEYFLVQNAAHGFNEPMMEKLHEVLLLIKENIK